MAESKSRTAPARWPTTGRRAVTSRFPNALADERASHYNHGTSRLREGAPRAAAEACRMQADAADGRVASAASTARSERARGRSNPDVKAPLLPFRATRARPPSPEDP